MIITLGTKPETGARSRTCKVCGDAYYGWNYVSCSPCEQSYRGRVTIVEAWRSEPFTRIMGA